MRYAIFRQWRPTDVDPVQILRESIALDAEANNRHAPQLHAPQSIPVLIIPADEESEIARLTAALLGRA